MDKAISSKYVGSVVRAKSKTNSLIRAKVSKSVAEQNVLIDGKMDEI